MPVDDTPQRWRCVAVVSPLLSVIMDHSSSNWHYNMSDRRGRKNCNKASNIMEIFWTVFQQIR
jgi:hypothetical protein